nr:hypothetical protein [uncultured Rhodoferax sp.]
MRDIQAIRRKGERPIVEEDLEVLGIETAVDGYIPGSDRTRLAEAVTHLVRHIAKRPAGHPRATGPKTFKAPATPRELAQLIDQGASINMGARDASFRLRAYLKDYDTIQGKRQQLPVDHQRARIEATLEREDLPFNTISGWRQFPFQSLSSSRFAMVRPVATEGVAAVMQSRQTFLGRAEDAYKIRPSDRRKRPVNTRRDSVTNDAIRKALESLTRRQSCQNSESVSVRQQPLSGGADQQDPAVLNTLMQRQSLSPRTQSVVTTGADSTSTPTARNSIAVHGAQQEEEFEITLPDSWGSW